MFFTKRDSYELASYAVIGTVSKYTDEIIKEDISTKANPICKLTKLALGRGIIKFVRGPMSGL